MTAKEQWIELADRLDCVDAETLEEADTLFRASEAIRVMNSTIPCHRGGHHCRWPACPPDCDGRPGTRLDCCDLTASVPCSDCPRMPSKEEIARRIMKCWGYQWVEFEELAATLKDSPERKLSAERYSARLDAQDAASAVLTLFTQRGIARP